MRIDAHHHLWRINRGDYGWITPDIPILYQDYLEEDIAPKLNKNHIEKTIVVQAAPTIAETEFILAQSEMSNIIAGVVGWIDIEDPLYQKQLESFLQHPKFIGIRLMIQDMKDERVILSKQYIEAFRYFSALDLPVDLLVRADQLPTVVKLLDQISIRGVINHIAKPDIANKLFHPWSSHIDQIAKHPNIYCKLSGMVTEADHGKWETEHFVPFIHHIIEKFGVKRVLYGSDWPVCLLSADYDQVIQLLQDALPDCLSQCDKDLIFGENANEFYKLGL